MNPILDFILALITLLSGAGWLTERRKRRAESEKAELDVSTTFVKEFNENIVNPLKEEINKLRSAINAVSQCPSYPPCPIVDELRKTTAPVSSADMASASNRKEL